jgi:hypothetical protein
MLYATKPPIMAAATPKNTRGLIERISYFLVSILTGYDQFELNATKKRTSFPVLG